MLTQIQVAVWCPGGDGRGEGGCGAGHRAGFLFDLGGVRKTIFTGQGLLLVEAVLGMVPVGATALQKATGSPSSRVKSSPGLPDVGEAWGLQDPARTDGDVIGTGLITCTHKAETESSGKESAPLAKRPGRPGARGDWGACPSSVGRCWDPCRLSRGWLLRLGCCPALMAFCNCCCSHLGLGRGAVSKDPPASL